MLCRRPTEDERAQARLRPVAELGVQVPHGRVALFARAVVLKDGKYSVSVAAKEVESGTYKTDSSKKPAQIDSTITSKGKDEGKTQLGIYKLDGDMMSVAFGKAGGKDRPKNFEGGEDIEVTVLKRKK